MNYRRAKLRDDDRPDTGELYACCECKRRVPVRAMGYCYRCRRDRCFACKADGHDERCEGGR